MKRRSKSTFVKTSISLPDKLWGFAVDQAEKEGFNSVSAYLSYLVRRDRDHMVEIKDTAARHKPMHVHPKKAPTVIHQNQ